MTIATTPTTTITPRSTAGGSRRPTVAPIWPPTTDPTAISAAARQSTSETNRKTTAAIAVDHQRQHVLGGVVPLHAVDHTDAQDRHQQHALRGAEVAAVHAGEQHRGPHPPDAVVRYAAARLGAGRDPLLDRRAEDHQQQPSAISTGTIASKADEGSTSRSSAPATAPTHDADASRSTRERWPASSAR